MLIQNVSLDCKFSIEIYRKLRNLGRDISFPIFIKYLSFKRDICCFDFRSNFLVSISFRINIGKEMSFPGSVNISFKRLTISFKRYNKSLNRYEIEWKLKQENQNGH